MTELNNSIKNIKSLNEGAKAGIQGGLFAPTNVKNSLYTTYLHQNIEKSTLDPGSEIAYAKLGKNSPIKYDMIKDFVMFNVQTLLTQLENTDFGMEIADIEGDLTIGCELLVSVIASEGSTHLLNFGDKCSTFIGSLFEESVWL